MEQVISVVFMCWLVCLVCLIVVFLLVIVPYMVMNAIMALKGEDD